MEAIALRLEAIALRLEAIALRLEAIAGGCTSDTFPGTNVEVQKLSFVEDGLPRGQNFHLQRVIESVY